MNEGRRILITGANGFLGSALSERLTRNDWNVTRATRRQTSAHAWRLYDLEAGPENALLDDIDIIVHAAYIPDRGSRNAYEANVRGSAALIELAHRRSKRIVFISSLSAQPSARSAYGRQKYRIETLLDPGVDTFVRPGLIVGSGGVFKRFYDHVHAGRPVPLVDGGTQPLQTVHIDDAVTAIEYALQTGRCGELVVAEAPAVPYKTFFRELAVMLGRKPRLVPVPSALLLAIAGAAACAHLRSPIDRDNVLGLIDMQFIQPTSGQPPIRNFRESLQAFLSER